MLNSIIRFFRRLSGKPQWEHDCASCTFLGHYRNTKENYDLYYCANEPTLIARHSSDGPDYTSGIVFGARAIIRGDLSHPLAVAMQRAKERGIDLGKEGDLRLVRYCIEHKRPLAPTEGCWECFKSSLARKERA